MTAVYTDSMECLKTLTVQLPQKPSEDHGCSRYLITCRVVRTILEILGIQSSVPKEACVPTQKKMKTSQDGDEDIDSSPSSPTRNRLGTSSGAKIRLRGPYHVMLSALGQVSLQIVQLALKPVRQFDTRAVFVFCVSLFFVFSLQYWSILGMGTAACWQAFTDPLPPDSWEDLWDPKDWWSCLLFSVSWHWGRTVQKRRLSPHHSPCLLHWSNCKDGTISWNHESLKTRRNN